MREKKPSDYRAAWDSLKFRAVALQADTTARGLPPGDPKVQADEAAVAALNAQKDAVAHKAWLTTARDLADPALLAEIAFDQFWDIATFPQFPADSGDRDNQEVAVAYLVRGIADAAQAQQAGTQGEGAMANEPHSPAPARPEPARAAPGNKRAPHRL